MRAVAETRTHIVVRGRVQGVGYRAFVERAALQAGIGGWVRNRRDGMVEAVLLGTADQVNAMIAACREGPFAAHVSDIEQREARADELALRRPGELFSMLPTV